MQKIHQVTERPENNIYRQVEETNFSLFLLLAISPLTPFLTHSVACLLSSKLPLLLTCSPQFVLLLPPIFFPSFPFILPPFLPPFQPPLSIPLLPPLYFFLPHPSSFLLTFLHPPHSTLCANPIPLIALILHFTHNHHQSLATYMLLLIIIIKNQVTK